MSRPTCTELIPPSPTQRHHRGPIKTELPRRSEDPVDLAKQQIVIIAIKEDSNTADDSTEANYLRRIGPGKGAHQVDATSERVKQ